MQDIGGNSGRPASTGGFQQDQKGFATPEEWNQTTLGVSAPLNVNAAPVGAARLAAALQQFQQQSQVGIERRIYANAERDFAQGKANPVGVKADGTLDMDSVKDKSAAFQEGAARSGAINAAHDAYFQYQQWKADPKNGAANMTPQQLLGKLDEITGKALNGMQSMPVAKEEIAPLLQRWHEDEGMTQLHTQVAKEHADQLDSAYQKAKTLATTGNGQVDWDDLIKKNLLPATEGDYRQANLMAIDIAGRIDYENGNTKALDALESQVGKRDQGGWGMEAYSRFDSRRESALGVQQRNETADRQDKSMHVIMGIEHEIAAGRPPVIAQLDYALSKHWLTDSQYHEYMAKTTELTTKIDRNQAINAFVRQNPNVRMTDLIGRSPGIGKDKLPMAPLTAEEAKNIVSETLDQKVNAQGKPLSPEERAVAAVGFAKTNGVWDPNALEHIKNLDFSNPKDVAFGNDWYTYAQQTAGAELQSAGLPKDVTMQLIANQNRIAKKVSAETIASDYAKLDPQTRKEQSALLNMQKSEILRAHPDEQLDKVPMSKLANSAYAQQILDRNYDEAITSGRFHDGESAYKWAVDETNRNGVSFELKNGDSIYMPLAGPLASANKDQVRDGLRDFYGDTNLEGFAHSIGYKGDPHDLHLTYSRTNNSDFDVLDQHGDPQGTYPISDFLSDARKNADVRMHNAAEDRKWEAAQPHGLPMNRIQNK